MAIETRFELGDKVISPGGVGFVVCITALKGFSDTGEVAQTIVCDVATDEGDLICRGTEESLLPYVVIPEET